MGLQVWSIKQKKILFCVLRTQKISTALKKTKEGMCRDHMVQSCL